MTSVLQIPVLRLGTVSDQYGGALCLDDDVPSDVSECSRAKLTQMKSEAAQRLDDLEKLIGEHQEIVEELKRTESSQGSLVDLVKSPAADAETEDEPAAAEEDAVTPPAAEDEPAAEEDAPEDTPAPPEDEEPSPEEQE